MRKLVSHIVMIAPLVFMSCRDAKDVNQKSGGTTLPPVYPKGPGGNTGWDNSAGDVLVVAGQNSEDSAVIVLPDVTDSTISVFHGVKPSFNDVAVDLFGRSGKIVSSATVTIVSPIDTSEACVNWPAAKVSGAGPGWSVGFLAGHVRPIALDSIETLSSVDSAALAASLTQNAALISATSDPAFRGLPFRIRSAYTFHFDSVAGVVADVVRTVNVEATPRLEHLLMIGEKPLSSPGKYSVVYYSRSAGAEESTQVSELLAMISLGASPFPIAVLDVEYGDGRRFALIEREKGSRWRTRWRSAFTDC